MTAVYCSSTAPESLISSRRGSLQSCHEISWLLGQHRHGLLWWLLSQSHLWSMVHVCHFFHLTLDFYLNYQQVNYFFLPHTVHQSCTCTWIRQCQRFCLKCHQEACCYKYTAMLSGLSSLWSKDSHITVIWTSLARWLLLDFHCRLLDRISVFHWVKKIHSKSTVSLSVSWIFLCQC